MKKKMIFLILILSGCSNGITPKEAFENDYVEFKGKEHVFVKVNYDEFAETLIEGTGVVVFGFNPNIRGCPFCDEAFPIMNEAALTVGITEILYMDIYNMRNNNTYQYQFLYNYLTNPLNEKVPVSIKNALLENERILVPDIYVVSEGVILGHHIAMLFDEEDGYIRNLDEVQTSEVHDIYIDLFELLLN